MQKNRKEPVSRPTPLDRMLGRNLAIRREAIGMTQDDFCEKWGYSKPLLSQLENGKKPFNSTTLSAILDVLNISLAELAGGEILSPEDQEDLDLLRAHREAKQRTGAIKEKLQSPAKQ